MYITIPVCVLLTNKKFHLPPKDIAFLFFKKADTDGSESFQAQCVTWGMVAGYAGVGITEEFVHKGEVTVATTFVFCAQMYRFLCVCTVNVYVVDMIMGIHYCNTTTLAPGMCRADNHMIHFFHDPDKYQLNQPSSTNEVFSAVGADH